MNAQTSAHSRSNPDRLLRIHQALCKNFHPPFVHANDRLGPLSQLVYALVARGAREGDADAAFRRLCAGYWSWAALRDEPRWRIESLLGGIPLADQKARCILEMLAQVSDRSSWREPSLSYLAVLPDDEALRQLETLSGVTPRISRAVLLFSSLRRPVLPLDSHGFRCAVRLGLIRADVDEDHACDTLRALLPAAWNAADFERHFFAFRNLGRNYCTPRAPRCGVCPVRAHCLSAPRIASFIAPRSI